MNEEQMKFRVWEKGTKNLLGYEYFNTPLNNGFMYTNLSELKEGEDEGDLVCHSEFYDPPMLKPKYFNQLLRELYTGKLDADGKEIYKGDILHFKTYESGGFLTTGIDCYAEVVFGDHNLTDDSLYRSNGFYLLTGKSHTPTSIHYWVSSHKATIVGNIHQTPEFLKK